MDGAILCRPNAEPRTYAPTSENFAAAKIQIDRITPVYFDKPKSANPKTTSHCNMNGTVDIAQIVGKVVSLKNSEYGCFRTQQDIAVSESANAKFPPKPLDIASSESIQTHKKIAIEAICPKVSDGLNPIFL